MQIADGLESPTSGTQGPSRSRLWAECRTYQSLAAFLDWLHREVVDAANMDWYVRLVARTAIFMYRRLTRRERLSSRLERPIDAQGWIPFRV